MEVKVFQNYDADIRLVPQSVPFPCLLLLPIALFHKLEIQLVILFKSIYLG